MHWLAPLRRLSKSLVAVSALAASAQLAAAEITVSAAASLTDAFKEVSAAYEARHPADKVRLNFAASGTLLQQIAKGAPVDVFASADLATMDKAQEQNLITVAQRRNFARNTLVLVTPKGATVRPASLADLGQASVRRIAIGNPASVPVGRYTQQALNKANLWSAYEPKLINAQSVRQVLDYVARGEVDVGFVYATDAAIMKDKVDVTYTVPLDEPVTYPLAPVAASANPASALAFVDFVTGPEGQAILSRYGFSKP